MSAKTPHLQPSDQSNRFIDAARELGCDEDEAAFKAKLGVIAQQKPKVPETKGPPHDKTA
jgi:hypothetical protein